ncbi:MAG: portal protein [Epsilonproteobacteria bacterium]|nr:portal protein [Campylobacterota bacterium]
MNNYNSNIIWIIVRRMRTPLIVIIITFSISILGMVLIPGVDSNGNPYRMNFLDAFYFVTYMATTIGFGEIPYEFTYAQRLWVIFSIFIGVVGWFYAIGALVSLIQDQKLLTQLNISRFQKRVKSLREPFIIILGYNNTTKDLIHKLSSTKRIVVIDKDPEKIDELELENFIPEVYALAADVNNPEVLKIAGIKSRFCKGMVALFENDFKNTKIALLARLLNDRINLIVKSTTKEQTEHLKNLGIKNIVDPFNIVANRFYLAITSPSLWLLEMMFFGHDLHIKKEEFLPKGKYIICGYGRMGKALGDSLTRAGLEYTYIDLKSTHYKKKKNSAIFGDAEDYKMLLKAGVKEAVAIIAATKDDLINLTILLTAKKINPNIYTIGRENTLDDVTIFKAAKIDRVYILEEVMAEYVYIIIKIPLAHIFLKEIHRQSELWGEKILEKIKNIVGYEPKVYEIRVSRDETYALYHYLKEGGTIYLRDILKDYNNQRAKIVVLLVKNRKEQVTFMPDDDYEVKISDRFLLAATPEAMDDFELIVNNINELYYILTGEDMKFGVFKYLDKLLEKEKNEQSNK